MNTRSTILFALVIIFFGGGLYLDFLASRESITLDERKAESQLEELRKDATRSDGQDASESKPSNEAAAPAAKNENAAADREKPSERSSNPKFDEAVLKMVEFTKGKTESFTSSAKMLYDFAKVALGSLLTLLAVPTAGSKLKDVSIGKEGSPL